MPGASQTKTGYGALMTLHSMTNKLFTLNHSTKQGTLGKRVDSLLACIVLVVFTAFATVNAAPSMPDEVSAEQVQALKQRMQKLDAWLAKANDEKSGLAKDLKAREQEIDRLSKRIRQIRHSLRQNEAQIGSLRTREKQQKHALNESREALIKQIQSAYKQSSQTALQLLLDSDDPQAVARIMNYYHYFNAASTQEMDAFKAAVSTLNQTKTSLLAEQKALQEKQSALAENHLALIAKRNERRTLLAKLNANIKTESANLARLQADYTRLEGLLKEVEQAIAKLKLPSEAQAFKQRKAKLNWPTRGRVRVKFGARLAQGKLKSNGIIIDAKLDSAIASVHYGRVVFSDWIRGFGLMIIVDHGDGYLSLYGHNSSLAKDTGDWVNAGEVIAYAGEYEANGKSGLYFEIRKDGKPENPLKWLQK